MASDSESPMTSGTSMVWGAVATTMVTVSPRSAVLPAAGSWSMTVPRWASEVRRVVTRTSRPRRAARSSASSRDMPSKSGTRTVDGVGSGVGLRLAWGPSSCAMTRPSATPSIMSAKRPSPSAKTASSSISRSSSPTIVRAASAPTMMATSMSPAAATISASRGSS